MRLGCFDQACGDAASGIFPDFYENCPHHWCAAIFSGIIPGKSGNTPGVPVVEMLFGVLKQRGEN
jgi:hypothetical protein